MSYEGNEEFWFRFASLSESQVKTLRGYCASVDVRQKKSGMGRFVASFRLDATNRYEWLASFVRDCNLSDAEYGVFVSLVTTHDSEIVTLPSFVLEVHHQVGGQIEFSFTIVPHSP